MPNEPYDPRVYFAAERTMLAWLRTALAVIGLGFVVARFGLFLRLMAPHGASQVPHGGAVIGVALVLLGTIMSAGAAWQHARFVRGLAPSELPRDYGLRFGVWTAGLLSLFAAILAVWLILGSPTS